MKTKTTEPQQPMPSMDDIARKFLSTPPQPVVKKAKKKAKKPAK